MQLTAVVSLLAQGRAPDFVGTYSVHVVVQVVEVSVCKCKCRSVSVQGIFRKNPSPCFREKCGSCGCHQDWQGASGLLQPTVARTRYYDSVLSGPSGAAAPFRSFLNLVACLHGVGGVALELPFGPPDNLQ